MTLLISNHSPTPIYQQIVDQLIHAIMRGELAPGEGLPSIRALAADLKISVITTKRAYDELEQQGYIAVVPGKGCFVADQSAGLLQESRLRRVEEKVNEAVEAARLAGLSREELAQMLALLWEE